MARAACSISNPTGPGPTTTTRSPATSPARSTARTASAALFKEGDVKRIDAVIDQLQHRQPAARRSRRWCHREVIPTWPQLRQRLIMPIAQGWTDSAPGERDCPARPAARR